MKRFLALLFCFVGLVHADLSLSTEDRSLANLNIEVSKGEYHLFDYFIWEPSISRPEKMKLFVKSEALSFRLVKDRKSYQFSMTEPIYAFVAFAGSLAYNQHYGYAPFYVITYLFNPSVELFLGRNMSRCRCLWGIISISFGSVSILHFTLSRISI